MIIAAWTLYFLGGFGTYWMLRTIMHLDGVAATKRSTALVSTIWPVLSLALALTIIFSFGKEALHVR